jgi:hypothetical protein
MAPCSTLNLKMSTVYTKMYEEQKHKMWLIPTAIITQYQQLPIPKDKKHDTSCTSADKIQLNVISVSRFITLTCDISHLIIQVLVQYDHYGCTCDCCKLMIKVPFQLDVAAYVMSLWNRLNVWYGTYSMKVTY